MTYTEMIMSFLAISQRSTFFLSFFFFQPPLHPSSRPSSLPPFGNAAGSRTAHVMFANSPNENVSQQCSHFTHILSWSVYSLTESASNKERKEKKKEKKDICGCHRRTDARALSYLAIRHVQGVMPKKKSTM